MMPQAASVLQLTELSGGARRDAGELGYAYDARRSHRLSAATASLHTVTMLPFAQAGAPSATFATAV
jgi:hypothetical protein